MLDGGLVWQEMSLSPKDMDFIQSRNISAREIALVFGVPAPLLGIQGDTTYNNMAEAKQDLWISTIIPLAEEYIGQLNRWLVPRYSGKLTLIIDKESVDALSPIRKEKFERISKAEFLTINEKRTALGFDALEEGGDDVLVSATQIPLSLISLGFDEGTSHDDD